MATGHDDYGAGTLPAPPAWATYRDSVRFVPWRVAPNSWTRDFSPASVAVVLLVWPALFTLVFFGPMGLLAVAAIPLTIWMGIRLSRLLTPSGKAHELRPCLECGSDTLSPTELCPAHRQTAAAPANES